MTEDFSSCTAGVANWMVARLDADEENIVHWELDWSGVCPLLTDQGWARTTGWQSETVTFTAPAQANPANSTIAFAIGGWNYDAWYGLVDEVVVSQ